MSENVLKGIIIKGIGGFYYIEAEGDIYECKARGAFRKKKISPLAGDNVIITVRENGENTIDEIVNDIVLKIIINNEPITQIIQ